MPVHSTSVSLRALDGLRLAGTLVTPDEPVGKAVVLVHGGGVTREEGGFFTRLAAGLADTGVASLRFDLRGHGESEGRQEDLTLTTILNDIRVALASVRDATGAGQLSLLGASFTGGVCAYYAARRREVDRLVLLNPQLDYKQRTIDSRPYWHDDQIDEEMAGHLRKHGYIQFTPSLRHGRPILNEVFWFKPLDVLGEIWVVAGAVAYRWILMPIRRNRNVLSRRLPFTVRNDITICYGLLPPRQGHVYYTVEEGDLAAITYADSALVGLYGRKRVETLNFQAVEIRLGHIRNLLLISGPKFNIVTKRL